MIYFITTPGHGPTVDGLRHSPFEDATLPRIRTVDYISLLRTDRIPYATYIFADIERLYPWERRAVAERFAGMRAAGLRCLNDPARVLTRYPLLRALAREGINPFDVYLAEDAPRPRRFPVFLRSQSGHGGATSAIDWGRADHAVAEGRHAVFEINTNPFLNRLAPPPESAYHETRLLARRRLAGLLRRIDSAAGERVAVEPGPVLAELRRRGQLAESEPLRP